MLLCSLVFLQRYRIYPAKFAGKIMRILPDLSQHEPRVDTMESCYALMFLVAPFGFWPLLPLIIWFLRPDPIPNTLWHQGWHQRAVAGADRLYTVDGLCGSRLGWSAGLCKEFQILACSKWMGTISALGSLRSLRERGPHEQPLVGSKLTRYFLDPHHQFWNGVITQRKGVITRPKGVIFFQGFLAILEQWGPRSLTLWKFKCVLSCCFHRRWERENNLSL